MRLSINGVRAVAAAGVVTIAVSLPIAASATDSVKISSASGAAVLPATTVPPTVLGEELVPTSAPQVSPESVAPAVLGETVQAGGLAVTGSDVAGLAGIGAVLVAGGTALVMVRRRRSAHA